MENKEQAGLTEIENSIGRVMGNILYEKHLRDYKKASDKNEFVSFHIRGFIDEFDEELLEKFLSHCGEVVVEPLPSEAPLELKCGIRIISVPKVEIGLEEFKNKVQISRVVEVAHDQIKRNIINKEEKDQQAMQARFLERKNYQEYLALKEDTIDYLESQLMEDISHLGKINCKKEAKAYYKEIAKKVRDKINSFNSYSYRYRDRALRDGTSNPDQYTIIEDIYTSKLRNKTIERLKDIEGFSPYKKIITELIDVQPGYCKPERDDVIDYIDEWDLYYKEKPSIDWAINKLINYKLMYNQKVDAAVYLFLFQKKNITELGYKYLNDVIQKMEFLICEKEKKMGFSLARKYATKYGPTSKYLADISETPIELRNQKLFRYWKFNKMIAFQREIHSIAREAENLAREEMGLPKVRQQKARKN